MGAVTVAVHTVLGVGEVAFGDLLAREVGVGLVDTGVQHGALDARPVEPGLPRRRRTDLGLAPVQVGLALAVQPDLPYEAPTGL